MSNNSLLPLLRTKLSHLADAKTPESFLTCARKIDEIGREIVFAVADTLKPDPISLAMYESYLHSAATQIRAQIGRIAFVPNDHDLIHAFADNTDGRADDVTRRRMEMSSIL